MKYQMLLSTIIMAASSTSQSTIHDFSFETLEGETKSLSDFMGKKILIFNAASKCGFTPQYEELQKLHEGYGDKVVVIGFPANNFGKQEPGANDEIASFCQKNYGVSFIMASKVSVKGSDIHPIFEWLCVQENPGFTGIIRWNFEKFVLDENGILLNRFRSRTKPMSRDILDLFS